MFTGYCKSCEIQIHIMWIPQNHKPCPSHHHEFMGGLVTIPSHASCSWHLGDHVVFMNRYQHCQPL